MKTTTYYWRGANCANTNYRLKLLTAKFGQRWHVEDMFAEML